MTNRKQTTALAGKNMAPLFKNKWPTEHKAALLVAGKLWQLPPCQRYHEYAPSSLPLPTLGPQLSDGDTIVEAAKDLQSIEARQRAGRHYFGGGAAAAALVAKKENEEAVKAQGLRDDIAKELADVSLYFVCSFFGGVFVCAFSVVVYSSWALRAAGGDGTIVGWCSLIGWLKPAVMDLDPLSFLAIERCIQQVMIDWLMELVLGHFLISDYLLFSRTMILTGYLWEVAGRDANGTLWTLSHTNFLVRLPVTRPDPRHILRLTFPPPSALCPSVDL